MSTFVIEQNANGTWPSPVTVPKGTTEVEWEPINLEDEIFGLNVSFQRGQTYLGEARNVQAELLFVAVAPVLSWPTGGTVTIRYQISSRRFGDTSAQLELDAGDVDPGPGSGGGS